MIITSVFAAALVVSVPAESSVANFQPASDDGLSHETIASGRAQDAISELEASNEAAKLDPGQQINLGIAYAQQGRDQRARELFEAALTHPDPIELETAEGKWMDSRRLARKALRMLDSGDFAPARSERVTLRD